MIVIKQIRIKLYIFYEQLYSWQKQVCEYNIMNVTRVRECCLTSTQQFFSYIKTRRVWRYQRGNQNPYIEEEHTTQWLKEKVQKDKQRSTKHAYKTKDRVTRTPLKTGGELGCSGGVSSSCSTSGTRGVNLVTNPVISSEWGKHREVFIFNEMMMRLALHA